MVSSCCMMIVLTQWLFKLWFRRYVSLLISFSISSSSSPSSISSSLPLPFHFDLILFRYFILISIPISKGSIHAKRSCNCRIIFLILQNVFFSVFFPPPSYRVSCMSTVFDVKSLLLLSVSS